MKKILSFLALLGLILASNCTQIPENDDPILGIWARTEWLEPVAEEAKSSRLKKEWIFNDVYLGRYQEFVDHQLVYYTDFSWEVDSDGYTLIYYGTDTPPLKLLLKQDENSDRLEYTDGAVFAERERTDTPEEE